MKRNQLPPPRAGSNVALLPRVAPPPVTESPLPPPDATLSPLPPRKTSALGSLVTAIKRRRITPVFSLPLGMLLRAKERTQRPDVRGPEPPEPQTPSVKPMKPRRQAKVQAKFEAAAGALAKSSPGAAAAASPTLNARGSDRACVDAIGGMLGDVPAIAQRLMRDWARVYPGSMVRQRDAALLMARALQQALGSDARRAEDAWLAIVSGERMVDAMGLDDATRRDANAALRAIAETPLAFDALWTLKRVFNHAEANEVNREAHQFALQAAAKLLELGHDPGGAQDIADFDTIARARSHGAPRIGRDEGPEVLACLTLLHARRTLAGDGRPSHRETAAHVAWRNGHRTSGPGTPFNDMVHRLHKFTVWVDRATSDRSGLRQVYHWLKSLGHGVSQRRLSPLDAGALGTLGAELGELEYERKAFAISLGEARDKLCAQLAQRANTLAANVAVVPGAQRQLDETLARLAVLQHWAQSAPGRKNWRIDPEGIRHIEARLANTTVPVDPKAGRRAAAGALTLTRLKRWADEAMPAGSEAHNGFMDDWNKARAFAKGKYHKATSRPDIDELEEIVKLALDTEGVQFRHARDGGAQVGVALAIPTPIGTIGINAGPVFTGAIGRQATVRVGTTTIGSDIFLGTERRSTKVGGFGASVGVDALDFDTGVLSGGPAFLWRRGWRSVEGHGVSLRASKNCKDHKKLAGAAAGFLFEQARRREEGESFDAAKLWERLARKFVDRPELAIDHVHATADEDWHTVGLGGGVRVGVSPITFGPFFSAGAEFRDGEAKREESGHTVSQVASRSNAADASALATLAGTAVAQVKLGLAEELGKGGLKVRFPAVASLASLRGDFVIGGENIQVRLTVENGRVQPKLSLVQHMFRTDKELMAHVHHHRPTWEARLNDGANKLDRFFADMHALPTDGASANRIYQQRMRLTDRAADTLTHLLAHLAQAERSRQPGAQQDAASLRQRMLEVMTDPASLVPEKLAVSEVATAFRETGFSLLAMFRSRKSATSTNRYLLQLKPDR